MVEKKPCFYCKGLVPERSEPPYPGHKEGCTLVAKWTAKVSRSELAEALRLVVHGSGSVAYAKKVLDRYDREAATLIV